MPDLLLELFSEEIPARMQRRAAEDLKKLVTDALVEAGLVYEGAKAFATPRRLALTVHGLPARTSDAREERKGPRVGAPDKAVAGFLKSAGLSSVDEAKVQKDPKGDFYLAVIDKPGRAAPDVIAEIVPAVVRDFPWPKSMRWGEPEFTTIDGACVTDNAGNYVLAKPWLSWIRPLHSILCVFGPETSDTETIDFEIDGIRSGNVTYGHRFMAPGPIEVRRFDDYVDKLEKAKVVLDADRRKEIIHADAHDRALALGLELVEDEGLLEEAAGLVEWPVVLAGTFDEAFLDIPPEVVRTTIRSNQKCFVLREPTTNALANRFIVVANIEAPDGGNAIVAGNERVIAARLADAHYFYDTDLKPLPGYEDAAKPLDQRLAKMKAQNIVFHEKLGTQGERVERIVRLAQEIAPLVGADVEQEARSAAGATGIVEKAGRAASLAKADLMTEMVGEFPELQGLMGKYYALAQGEDASVAVAVEDHYKPVGPSDRVPTDPVAVAVALADKLDMLVGFWAIDEKPTGSKDPFALRRAALGVIRIVLENNLRLALSPAEALAYEGIIHSAWQRGQLLTYDGSAYDYLETSLYEVGGAKKAAFPGITRGMWYAEFSGGSDRFDTVLQTLDSSTEWFRGELRWFGTADEVAADLLAFFHDRLKVQLREQGARHDLVDAVLALGQGTVHPPLEGEGRAEGAGWGGKREEDSTPSRRASPVDLPPPGGGEGSHRSQGAVQDDLVLIVRRIEALGAFLDTDDGANLLVGTKRATNILREEEKKSGETYDGEVDPKLLTEPEERTLFEAIGAAEGEVRAAVEVEDFADAMRALAKLRAPVDAFFDKVLVNAPDKDIRANRLRLLNRIRQATLTVADFSRIAG